MNVNDDMITRYFDGNANKEEKKLVRTYLCNNPDKLETIMHLMDDDVDYLGESDKMSITFNDSCICDSSNLYKGDVTFNYKNNYLEDSSDDFLRRLRKLSKDIDL